MGTYEGLSQPLYGAFTHSSEDKSTSLEVVRDDGDRCWYVTDTGTDSSGYLHGFYFNATQNGVKSGSAEWDAVQIDLTVEQNTPRSYALSIYTALSGTVTIDSFSAINVYMDVLGSSAVENQYIVRLEADTTHDVGGCNAFIYLYRHGSGNQMDCVFRWDRASGSPNGTADYFIKAPAISINPFESGDITSGKTCIGGLRCINGSTVGVIPLYSD